MKTLSAHGEPPLKSTRHPSSRAAETAPAVDLLRIKTILVPLDFSETSMRVLRYTVDLAENFKAAIHLVHVQPTDELTGLAQAGHFMLDHADAVALLQDRLAELQKERRASFWPDNCHVLSGSAPEEVCRLAGELMADLIVLPTRTRSALQHAILGSVAEKIVRLAPCPVLVLHRTSERATRDLQAAGSAPFPPREILVPIDFSPASLDGARYGASLARSTGAILRLLHVVFPYSEVVGIDRIGAHSDLGAQRAREAAEEEMARLLEMKFLRGVKCESKIRVGDAVEEIVRESQRPGIDLLVTSTHGRSGWKRLLLGSVTERVVRDSKCPVIAVPSRSCP